MGIWNAFIGFMEWVLLELSILTGSVGIGIIIFTICARLVILPLTITSIRSSRRMQEMQPMMKELQRKYGKEPQKYQEEMLKFYRENKINPAGGCLPLLLQLPFFFGVYFAVYHLMGPGQQQYLSENVQAMIQEPAVQALLATPFLGLDLGRAAFAESFSSFSGWQYLILPVLSVFLQFVQQLMAMPRVMDPQQKAMMQVMLFMPLVFAYVALIFPAGAVLYWVTGSLFGIVQQYFISGWGSLANYLKFLPVDSRTPALAAASGSVTSNVTADESSDVPAAPRRDFWTVMQPLVELNVAASGSSGAATESAAEGERKPAKAASSSNLRRPRRRR